MKLILLGLLLVASSHAVEVRDNRAFSLRVHLGRSPRFSLQSWNYWSPELEDDNAIYIVGYRDLHKGRPLVELRRSGALFAESESDAIYAGVLLRLKNLFGTADHVSLCTEGGRIIPFSVCALEEVVAEVPPPAPQERLPVNAGGDFPPEPTRLISAQTLELKVKLRGNRSDFQIWAAESASAGRLGEFRFYTSGIGTDSASLWQELIDQVVQLPPNSLALSLCARGNRIISKVNCEQVAPARKD